MDHDAALVPTSMVIAAVRERFAAVDDDESRITALAHLIEAAVATSYARGLTRARDVAVEQDFLTVAARIDAILEDVRAHAADKGYPGQVSMLDAVGKLLLLQVDGDPEEIRPLAKHLREVLGFGAIVVVLPTDASLQAMSIEGLDDVIARLREAADVARERQSVRARSVGTPS